MSDKEILNLCLDASTRESGFKLLVSAYSKKIYLHVRRMVTDHDDANDVVQNCFIKAWKGLSNFREDSQLFTWIYRIATNESITFLNNKNRKNRVSFSGNEAYFENIKEETW
ncbi:MAG: RNA polymerase sigma factor, partial [Chitinophagales bacterium]